MEIIKRNAGVFAIAFFLVFFAGHIGRAETASAADLVFSPETGISESNTPFVVNVLVSGNAAPINAVSGAITFPKDIVSVESVSKDGSFVTFWSEEPQFSNNDGTIRFEGVVFNPGFSGQEGKVLSIRFMPKRQGSATFLFSGGSILANDGKATDVLGEFGVANFTISSGEAAVQTVATTPTGNPLLPLAPSIVSKTHPDTGKWYNENSPVFSWNLPSDVTAVRLLYDKSPSSIPTKVYIPPISSKTLEEVPDGIYYFHAQFQNKFGWGAVSHFRFGIDTIPPERFAIRFSHGNESDDPQPIIEFNTPDLGSGIDHYEIKTGEGDLLRYAPLAISNPYAMPHQSPGEHTVLVRAIDKAGNSTTESANFTVLPIEAPEITSYTKDLQSGDIVKIEGTTYPYATVEISIRDDESSEFVESTKSGAQGDFELIWSKKLRAGVYEFTAKAIDSRGALSNETPPYKILVEQRPLFKIGKIVVNYLSVVLIIILGAALLFGLIWFIISRFVIFRKKIRRDMADAETTVHDRFNSLRKEIESHLKILEKTKKKRLLTDEEALILKNLKEHFDTIEHDIGRKLQSLKKDLR